MVLFEEVMEGATLLEKICLWGSALRVYSFAQLSLFFLLLSSLLSAFDVEEATSQLHAHTSTTSSALSPTDTPA